MAKLYFNYSSMNAGKSTMLLQANHNYTERGMNAQLYTSELDTRFGNDEITSRIGLKKKSNIFTTKTDIYSDILNKNNEVLVDCLLIDEAQFLTKEQVRQIGLVADRLNYPVMCYGIRTDFRGELFEGSSELLALADNLIELKTICSLCSRKATMVVRKDDSGEVVTEGSKVVVGGNDIYMPVCRKHYRKLTKLI